LRIPLPKLFSTLCVFVFFTLDNRGLKSSLRSFFPPLRRCPRQYCTLGMPIESHCLDSVTRSGTYYTWRKIVAICYETTNSGMSIQHYNVGMTEAWYEEVKIGIAMKILWMRPVLFSVFSYLQNSFSYIFANGVLLAKGPRVARHNCIWLLFSACPLDDGCYADGWWCWTRPLSPSINGAFGVGARGLGAMALGWTAVTMCRAVCHPFGAGNMDMVEWKNWRKTGWSGRSASKRVIDKCGDWLPVVVLFPIVAGILSNSIKKLNWLRIDLTLIKKRSQSSGFFNVNFNCLNGYFINVLLSKDRFKLIRAMKISKQRYQKVNY